MLEVTDRDDHWLVSYIDSPAQGKKWGLLSKLGKSANPIELWRKEFPAFKDLPEKTQDAVAALSMCGSTGSIEGYGKKVSGAIYWLDSTPEMLGEYEK